MISFSRRWWLKAAAVGGTSTLAGWFPSLKFSSANMLKQSSKQSDDQGATNQR